MKGSSSPEDEGFGVSERTFLHVVKDVHKLVYGSTSASQLGIEIMKMTTTTATFFVISTFFI
jgi:hypothetical protein